MHKLIFPQVFFSTRGLNPLIGLHQSPIRAGAIVKHSVAALGRTFAVYCHTCISLELLIVPIHTFYIKTGYKHLVEVVCCVLAVDSEPPQVVAERFYL